MELAKHIKPLVGDTDWPIWKRKIRDLLDYHEGAQGAIDGRLEKPEPLQVASWRCRQCCQGAQDEERFFS
jgi:hypothetical protein